MKEMSDSELLELTKQSSYPAFNELYQRYWKYIYTIAYKKLGDKDEAADLTQNVFMEFYHKRENLVINITISNTDDHLRNHGFLLTDKGWVLSPAYDVNPSTDKNGLALNIDMDNNTLDLELAKSVGVFFRLTESDMEKILGEVLSSVNNWRKTAKQLGISRAEQELMQAAFRFSD